MDWQTGGLADWWTGKFNWWLGRLLYHQTGGLADWRSGGMEDSRTGSLAGAGQQLKLSVWYCV